MLVALYETLAGDVLVKLDVAFAYRFAIGVGHFGNCLAGFAHESVFDEPLTHKLLGELTLGFALLKALLVAVGIEVT